jgi:hypothetical protein
MCPEVKRVMKEEICAQIEKLKSTSFKEIHSKYVELFNDNDVSAAHKTYMLRKIAYRLQELELGGMSSLAQKRLKDLIGKYDPINNKAFRPEPSITKVSPKDRRLPIPGTVITKEYKGCRYTVKVLEKGFEYEGKFYNSLSAIAKEITGSHWNGYLFFNL